MDTHDSSEDRPNRAVHLAAEMAQLCVALAVNWDAVERFLTAFESCLSADSAVSIDPRSGAIGIMTQGSGQTHAYRVAQFMGDTKLSEPVIEQFLSRVRHFDAQNISIKAEIDRRGIRELTTYVRQPIGIKVTHACIADAGVDSESVGLMEAVFETLGAPSATAVATAVTVSGDTVEKVYCSPKSAAGDWGRIRAVGRLAGLSDAEWAPVDNHRSALSLAGLEVSLGFRGGRAIPGLALAFQSVNPAVVDGLLATAAERTAADQLRLLRQQSDHDRVRIRLVPGGPVGLKACALHAHANG